MDVKEFRDELLTSFLVVQSYLEDSLNPVCRECGLTLQQFRILIELDRHPGRKTGDLSDTVGIQRGNIASICKKMEQNGWVERRRSQEDERIVMVSLTDKGRDAKKTVENMMTDRVRAVLERESEETFDNIRAGLASLCKVMERINSYE